MLSPAILEFFIVLLSVSVILSSLADSTLPRASFGETCGSNGTRCDSRAFLTCFENQCQCIKPKEMSFDKNQGKCLVLSGERCTYIAVEDSQEKRWTERLDCVENAKCNNEGFCSCIPKYYEDSQGFCVPKRMSGQTCSKIEKCREDQFLECIDGICKCNNSDTIFDSKQNQCVVRAGKSCSNGEPCVINAHCENIKIFGDFSGRHGYHYERQCTCSNYYKTSKNGLCLSQYGAQCNSQTIPCLEDLACINGLCSCPFPEHQFYHLGSRKCVSFVRGPCKENFTGNIVDYACISGAVCQNDNGTEIYECRCSKGFIESDKRTCAIEYGQSCETPNSSKHMCDSVAKLICKNGVCACPNFQVYNSDISNCQGLVGARCNLGEQFCVEGAYCHSYRETKLGEGVCKCDSGLIADSNRKCVVSS